MYLHFITWYPVILPGVCCWCDLPGTSILFLCILPVCLTWSHYLFGICYGYTSKYLSWYPYIFRYILTGVSCLCIAFFGPFFVVCSRSRGRGGGANADSIALRLACEAANRNWSLAEAEVRWTRPINMMRGSTS